MDNKTLTDKKKRVAAIAAVTTYIKSQEEMMAAMAAADQSAEAAPKPVALPSLWGVSGRQDLMQYRNLMQMKAFHGLRFK